MIDPMEHKPMVDEFFKSIGKIKMSINNKYFKLESERVTLYFNLTEKSNIVTYDGWETFVGDMNIEVKEN